MSRLIVISIIILILFMPSVICGEDYYVDIDNDGGIENGTSWANAWGKLSDIDWLAIDSSLSLDNVIIHISDGTYTEQILSIGATDPTHTLTIKRAEDVGHIGHVIIDGNKNISACFFVGSNDNYVIDGVDDPRPGEGGTAWIKCKSTTAYGIYSGAGITANNVIIRNIEIYDKTTAFTGSHSGIYYHSTLTNFTINNNYIHGTPDVYFKGSGMTFYGINAIGWETGMNIFNNLVAYIHVDGIKFSSKNSDPFKGYATVYGNTFWYVTYHDEGQSNAHADSLLPQTFSYMRAYNNYFHECANANYPDNLSSNTHGNYWYYNNVVYNNNINGYAWHLDPEQGSLHNIYIYNNTIDSDWGIYRANRSANVRDVEIINNSFSGIDTEGGSRAWVNRNGDTGWVVDYNNYNNLSGYISSKAGALKTFTELQSDGDEAHGNTETPLFIDRANQIYILQSNDTALKDQGTNLPELFSFDMNGNSRPQGPASDIGAYEFKIEETTPLQPPSNIRIQ